MADTPDESVWTEFLQTWPIERLRAMTLPEYTTAGDKNCFVYWLESRLDKFGSIWGGSAFKFGIYSRRATTEEAGGAGRMYDASYGWYSMFGSSSAEAFATVRTHVVQVAEAARDGRLEVVDENPLGDVYKWKIAFHYQSRDRPSIVCIFLRKPLLEALGLPQSDRSTPFSRLYREITSRREPGESVVAQSKRLWREWTLCSPHEIKLTEPMIRTGVLTFSPSAAPFPDVMHGGAVDAEAGQGGRFRTDTGMTFESDVRVAAPGKGELRYNLSAYFSAIEAKPGGSIVIAPQGEGEFVIARQGAVLPPIRPVLKPLPPPVPPVVHVKSNAPLNQILFGPPGTGKTFHAIDKALAILDPSFLQAHLDNRSALKARFDELTAEGLIQFVTFHQSFSYEDFVEGLRAETDEEKGTLRYEIVDGVFKRLCDSARTRVVKAVQPSFDPTGRRIWKLSLGNSETEQYVYDECIAKGIALVGFGAGADFSKAASREDILRVYETAGEKHAPMDYDVTAVNLFVRQMGKGDLLVVTDGNLKFRALGEVTGDYRVVPREDGDTYAQCRDVRWLRVYSPSLAYDQLMENRFSQMTLYQLREGSINFGKLKTLLQARDETVSGAKPRVRPRVLVIDEINRGNVSRIFGELITLIEPSKRAGAEEALATTLPYSRGRFSVPDNVYLIGTMNTTDRSLAGLDIALRRRFQFVEMSPRPDLLREVHVVGVNIGAMLTIMNERIEVLLDRDHQLGHAYFMSLRDGDPLARLAEIFRHQILPLLQEYFFEDWQRIAWVLNDHRKPPGFRFVVPSAFSVDALFGSGAEVPVGAKLWRIEDAAFEKPESYRGILSVGQG